MLVVAILALCCSGDVWQSDCTHNLVSIVQASPWVCSKAVGM